MTMDEVTLLGAAVLLEIPIAMVLLSRVLQRNANRLANIIGGLSMMLVMAGTLLMGGAGYHYVFFATIEIAATVFVVWFAWTWNEPEAARDGAGSGVRGPA